MAKRTPEYQRLDIEPKEGGKSLLHNEFGLKKIPPAKKDRVPALKELNNEPVMIKAKEVPQDDDKFIPPRSNFAHVGQLEHAWYDKEAVVDNNEEVDIDKIQGINPLKDATDPALAALKKIFVKKLMIIREAALKSLGKVQSSEQAEELKTSFFGKNGMFTSVLKEVNNYSAENRAVLGELISTYHDELVLEFDQQIYELAEQEDDEEFDQRQREEDESDFEEPKTDEYYEEDYNEADYEDQLPSEEELKTSQESTPELQEGEYAVLFDGKVMVVEDAEKARILLSRLLLGNNIEISRLQLIKRLPIDFGVLIRE